MFDEDSLSVCAAAVTSVTGDIRRALKLCCRAIELKRQGVSNDNPPTDIGSGYANQRGAGGSGGDRAEARVGGLIRVSDMHAAKQSFRASHHFRLIAGGTYFERLALVSLVRQWLHMRRWHQDVLWHMCSETIRGLDVVRVKWSDSVDARVPHCGDARRVS